MWISPEFKIYIVKEFQRLKEAEQKQLGWSVKRELAKINYRIHTSAIKQHLIPDEPANLSLQLGKFKRCISLTRGSLNTNAWKS